VESLISEALDDMSDNNLFSLLKPLSTKEKLTAWEVIENKIERTSERE
jgi:hypothetical protein